MGLFTVNKKPDTKSKVVQIPGELHPYRGVALGPKQGDFCLLDPI